MGESLSCAACGKPFAANLGACQYCGATGASKKAPPVRCASCERLYAAALAKCPFCDATGTAAPLPEVPAGIPDLRTPTPAEGRPPAIASPLAEPLGPSDEAAVDAHERRVRLVLGAIAGAMVLSVLLAWWLSSSGPRWGHARIWLLIGLAPASLAGWALRRYLRENAPGLGSWFDFDLGGGKQVMALTGLCLVPVSCFLYAVARLVDRAGSGKPEVLICTEKAAEGAKGVGYVCERPAGGRIYVSSTRLAGGVGPIEVVGRPGVFGGWELRPETAKPVRMEEPSVFDAPAPTPTLPPSARRGRGILPRGGVIAK